MRHVVALFVKIICSVCMSCLLTIPAFGQATRVYSLEHLPSCVELTLMSKGRYFGDAVSITIANRCQHPVRITALPGDVLVSKRDSLQNFVITKHFIMDIPPGQTKKHWGICAACVNAERDVPNVGEIFDITSNIRVWHSEAAQALFQLVTFVDKMNLCEEDFVQDAVWKITNNKTPSSKARDLLRRIGIDPSHDFTDFPKFTSPYSNISRTVYIPPSKIGIRTGPHRGAIEITLIWFEDVDLDLHVIEPDGTLIFSGNPVSLSGGLLDCETKCLESAVSITDDVIFVLPRKEHVYWTTPPPGQYIVEIHYKASCMEEAPPARWNVTIVIEGNEREYTGILYPEDEAVLVDMFVYSPQLEVPTEG